MELTGQKEINNFQSQDISQRMINSSPTPKPTEMLEYLKNLKVYIHDENKKGILNGPSL